MQQLCIGAYPQYLNIGKTLENHGATKQKNNFKKWGVKPC